MLSTKKIYYPFIDILKAIAIFLVVFYHSFCTTIDINFLSLEDYIEYFLYTILGIGVPLFFTVNGFLVFQKKCDLKKHILKIIKIILITGIWAVFSLALLMLLKNDKFYFVKFLKNLISLKQGYINYLWFMEALVFCHILYPLLDWAYRKHFVLFQIIFVIVVLYTIIIPTCCSINEIVTNKNFLIAKILNNLPGIYFLFSITYFMLGGIIYKLFQKIKITKKQLLLMIVLIILMLLFQTFFGILKSQSMKKLFDNVWDGYDSIFIFFSIIIIFLIAYQCYKEKRLLFAEKIGANSLGIYFIHPILIVVIMQVLRIEKICHNLIINLILSVLITVSSFYITMFLKKIPVVEKLVQL